MTEVNPSPTPGANPPPAGTPFKTFSTKEEHDEYLNGIVKDRLDRERKKYADYDGLKKAAEELAELKKGQMSEVDKLKVELESVTKALTAKDHELTGLKLERTKSARLAAAGISPEWIDSVGGSTEEEIQASVDRLANRLSAGTPKAAQGAGNPGVSGQPGKKVWARSEIQKILADPSNVDQTVLAEINLAQKEGRVDYTL
ncbi:MAG: hypothetical protein A4E45_00042 [Methanosaeta sp. PtaB.Bin039]|nr:MAG: hypothetical protein A4E45_00042 [Methanosaeta sp. PtaB.Bin039]